MTAQPSQRQDPMHLFLDTDIGTDVDDALALALILGSAELNLVGVSTVYGDTRLRAQLAARLMSLADSRGTVPIAAGERQTRSGRPVWWPGHEGKLHDDLHSEPIEPRDGTALLIETARRLPGELVVLAIGPLTNIAAALDSDPAFAENVGRLVIMGGDFRSEGREAEHNILSDVSAAQRVFESSLGIVVGGLDLTTQIKLSQTDVDRIVQAGPLGRALGLEIAEWWKFHGHSWNTPHDPILALWLTEPGLFSLAPASVRVQDSGKTIDDADPSSTTSVLKAMDVDEVRSAMVRRILASDRARTTT